MVEFERVYSSVRNSSSGDPPLVLTSCAWISWQVELLLGKMGVIHQDLLPPILQLLMGAQYTRPEWGQPEGEVL